MLAAMRRVRCFPGDLHLCMHLLVVVYGHYYGGFMQPFQVCLVFLCHKYNNNRAPVLN
jgi:hypothetical protein